MPSPDSRPSLRNELLVTVALLAIAAPLLSAATIVLLSRRADPAGGALLAGAIVSVDVMLVVALGALRIHRLVLRPLSEAASAADAIASGDLRRRIPKQHAREIDILADSVNRLTDLLLEEQAHLVRAEKLASVGRLAEGIAHEIGAPLRALDERHANLRGQIGTNTRALDTLAGVTRETARIDRIVRGLLDYARPRGVAATPIDVNASIRHVVDLLSAQGVLRRVELRIELANESPRIAGERQDLEQLLVNLLLNAAHAVAGTGTVAIRTTCMSRALLQEGMVRASDAPGAAAPHPPLPRVQRWLESEPRIEEMVKIVVADAGPGVPREDAERIFDPFYSTREPGTGTGLGLAIVLRIVECFQGIVWVQPAREGGAAFHLLLPLASMTSPPLIVEQPVGDSSRALT